MSDESSIMAPEPATDRGRETKQRILHNAEKVFGEVGYYEASVTRIAQASDIAQGTFYLYFPSKKDVLTAVVDYLATELREDIHHATEGLTDREDIERQGFMAFWNFVAKHPLSYRIVRQTEFIDPPTFQRYYRSLAKGYARGLSQAESRGEFADRDPEALAYALMGIGDFIGMRYVLFDEQGTVPDQVFHDVMAFIFTGLKGGDSR